MAAITISRQLGSLGFEVAQEVGRKLEYRVVWREIINQAARLCGSPELALATIDELGLLGLHPSKEARQAYHCALQTVMENYATEGGYIIVGRAGQAILKNNPTVLHVRITAPFEWRVEQLTNSQGISRTAASEQIKTSDQARKTYLQHYYHIRWDDPDLYDLTINTERVSVETASDLICLTLEKLLRNTLNR